MGVGGVFRIIKTRTVAFWGLRVGGARAGLGIVEGRFVADNARGCGFWV